MALQDYHNILVPVDGSDNALRAVDHAAALAGAADMQILLLHVGPLSPIRMLEAMGYPSATREEARKGAAEFEEARSAMAESLFKAARERIPEGIQVRQIVEAGDPAQVILDEIEKLGNAVVVMGNRGLSSVREVMLGSVSNKVLHRAACPVTIVR